MSQISHIFRKMMPQVLHILVLPLFFFAFMLLYRPFHADQLLGNDMYGVHVTIISCIVLLCVAICRLLYYFIPMYLNYSLYVTWCFGEMTITTFFVALYIWLALGRFLPYYQFLAPSLQMVVLTLVIPYSILGVSMRLYEYHQRARNPSGDESSRVRFYDDRHNLKISLHPNSLLYIASELNYVRMYYKEGDTVKNFLLRASMKMVEEPCNDCGLVRCHRSYFINPSHVKLLRKVQNGVSYVELDSDNSRQIPVSAKYYSVLAQLL